MYNYLVLGSILWSLAARAAPAPQASPDTANPCAVPGADLVMSGGVCVYVTPPDVNWAVTSTTAVAGAATGATAAVTNAQPAADSTGGSAEVVSPSLLNPPAAGVTAGAAATGVNLAQTGQADSHAGATSTGVTSAVPAATDATGGAGAATGDTTVVAAETTSSAGKEDTAALTDGTCVDEPNGLVDLKKTFTGDQWTMTSKDCPVVQDKSAAPRYVAYWSEWAKYDQLPTAKQLEGITHFVLSFAASDGSGWVPGTFTDVPFNDATITHLRNTRPEMKIMAAFGGWNLDTGFSEAAATGDMEGLASKIVEWTDKNKLQGIDLDWEFPSGGGAFYKSCLETAKDHIIPERPYEFDAYVDLVRHVRAKGPQLELSVAVPGRTLDQDYFPDTMIKRMDPCVDHFNLMSYDAMNRRDGKTAHHAGTKIVGQNIEYYEKAGMSKKKMNMGFPSFAKAFTMADPKSCTSPHGLGCDIVTAEKPTGQDAGTSLQFLFDVEQNPGNSTNLAMNDTLTRAHLSYPKLATEKDTYDEEAGAHAFVDSDNELFWTWTTAEDIKRACDDHGKDIGGVMLWSINQDDAQADGGSHIAAIAACAASMGGGSTDTSQAGTGAEEAAESDVPTSSTTVVGETSAGGDAAAVAQTGASETAATGVTGATDAAVAEATGDAAESAQVGTAEAAAGTTSAAGPTQV